MLRLFAVGLSAMIIAACGPIKEPVDASDRPIRITRIRGPVYLVEDLNYWKTNSVFYVNDSGGVFTGAGWTEKSAKQILWKAATLTMAEFTAVVPADHRLPYSGGLHEFKKQSVPIYLSKKSRTLMLEQWKDLNLDMSSFGSWKEIPAAEPDHIFDGTLEFLNGSVIVREIDAGQRSSAVAAYFPAERILFLGSALSDPPYFYTYDRKALRSSITELMKLPFEIAISGHGKAIRNRAFVEDQLRQLNAD